MNAFKIELLVVDHEKFGPEEIQTLLENSKYLHPKVMSLKSSDIGEWSDDHPLNSYDTMEAEYKKIFHEQP